MNVFIDPSLISEILLQDGWHILVPGTLHTGKFALVEPNTPPLSTPGFTFDEAGAGSIAGPLSSILAVRRAPEASASEAKEPPPSKSQSSPAPPASETGSRGWWEP
jgi:hypothetical protein